MGTLKCLLYKRKNKEKDNREKRPHHGNSGWGRSLAWALQDISIYLRGLQQQAKGGSSQGSPAFSLELCADFHTLPKLKSIPGPDVQLTSTHPDPNLRTLKFTFYPAGQSMTSCGHCNSQLFHMHRTGQIMVGTQKSYCHSEH